MSSKKVITKESSEDNTDVLSEEIIDADLVAFFDLLAKFDYEDHQKLLGVNIDPSASAPGGSILVSENSIENYGRADIKNT